LKQVFLCSYNVIADFSPRIGHWKLSWILFGISEDYCGNNSNCNTSRLLKAFSELLKCIYNPKQIQIIFWIRKQKNLLQFF